MAPEVAVSSNRTSHQLLAMRTETCRRDGQDKGGRAEFPGGRVDDVPIGAVSWQRKLICTTARGRVLVSPLPHTASTTIICGLAHRSTNATLGPSDYSQKRCSPYGNSGLPLSEQPIPRRVVERGTQEA
jgi:hypothetical protein